MKSIPKRALRKLITKYCDDDVELSDIREIFEQFGDDWYIVDGRYELCKKNKNREAEE